MPKRNDYQGTKYAQILHVDEPIHTTCYIGKGYAILHIYWSICITTLYLSITHTMFKWRNNDTR